jgi:AmmeMemoRadiSam system protein B
MSIRLPAVAGTFYDARRDRLEADVRSYLPTDAKPEPAIGAIVPHAGYVYSGPVAGAVYARLEIPPAAIILCPNHTGRGAPAALDPSEAWSTPLGNVPVDRDIARRLRELCPSLEEDSRAHAREHSLEVQLPFLQVRRPDIRFVPVSIGARDLELCREIGKSVARVVAEQDVRPLILASSDMNHFESRTVGREKDDRALARVEALDPEGLFATVLDGGISMCGVLPATALLFAARALGAVSARTVARRDSGDETGDTSSVVGYAGVIVTGAATRAPSPRPSPGGRGTG